MQMIDVDSSDIYKTTQMVDVHRSENYKTRKRVHVDSNKNFKTTKKVDTDDSENFKTIQMVDVANRDNYKTTQMIEDDSDDNYKTQNRINNENNNINRTPRRNNVDNSGNQKKLKRKYIDGRPSRNSVTQNGTHLDIRVNAHGNGENFRTPNERMDVISSRNSETLNGMNVHDSESFRAQRRITVESNDYNKMPQRVNMAGENCFKMSKKMKEVVSNIIENVNTSQEQNMDEDVAQLGSAGGIFRKPQRIRVRDTVSRESASTSYSPITTRKQRSTKYDDDKPQGPRTINTPLGTSPFMFTASSKMAWSIDP
jgi:hypothetical protein